MSRKKRKTRLQKEASSQKTRRFNTVLDNNSKENTNTVEVEVKSNTRNFTEKSKDIPDWVSDKIDNDLKTVFLYIGITLVIVAGIYVIIYQTDLLTPIFNKFNISY